MTPKEKAIELRDKFFGYTMNMNLVDAGLEMATECAIIAVDEIINSCPIEPSDTDWDDCGGSFQYWYPQKREDSLMFWEEVKTELEKL